MKTETFKALQQANLRSSLSILMTTLRSVGKNVDILLDKVMSGDEDSAYISIEFEKLRHSIDDIIVVSGSLSNKKDKFVEDLETEADKIQETVAGVVPE